MNARILGLALAVVCMTGTELPGQPSAVPAVYQSLTYIKVAPGHGDEFVAFMRETMAKAAQVRVDAGEIISWTLLQSVYPAGTEARANYMISVLYEGSPRPPRTRAETEQAFSKAGVTMKVAEYYVKRDSLSTLVALELWRPLSRAGALQKGHYLFLNMMKVHDRAAYMEFEQKGWQPMAEEWVKQKAMSGWIMGVKVLPSGTESAYTAYTADMFPTWEAAFAPRPALPVFEKVHPGKSYEEFSANIPKLRDLARREMWRAVERVEKKP